MRAGPGFCFSVSARKFLLFGSRAQHENAAEVPNFPTARQKEGPGTVTEVEAEVGRFEEVGRADTSPTDPSSTEGKVRERVSACR